jgi:DNA-binding SARP family transcriptional activator
MSAPLPALTIRFLGTFDVRRHGVPVLAFESDKARALLAYLAVEAGVAHRRDKLAGLFWPDWSDGEARAHLRHSLSSMPKRPRLPCC